MPFSKIIKELLKLGNDEHAFHKFAPFLGYLEIKKRATSTLKILLNNYETYILHKWDVNRNFSPTGS